MGNCCAQKQDNKVKNDEVDADNAENQQPTGLTGSEKDETGQVEIAEEESAEAGAEPPGTAEKPDRQRQRPPQVKIKPIGTVSKGTVKDSLNVYKEQGRMKHMDKTQLEQELKEGSVRIGSFSLSQQSITEENNDQTQVEAKMPIPLLLRQQSITEENDLPQDTKQK